MHTVRKSSFFTYLFLMLASISFSFSTFAAEEGIQNVRLSISDDYLNILWDPLPSEVMAEKNGYALQLGKRSSDISINKPPSLYEASTGKSLRAQTFKVPPNTTWYLRVYAYERENGKPVLSHGSKMIKFQIDAKDNITTEEITINDVRTTTTEETDESAYENLQTFSPIRVVAYDTFADLSWSRPRKLTKSDYDGYLLKISTVSNLSDAKEIKIPRDKTRIRLTGLTPNTTYYVRGYFYKESNTLKVFGEGPLATFKTLKLIDRNANTRAARNIKRIERRAAYKVPLTEETSSTTDNSTIQSTESTSTENTTSSTTLSSNTNPQTPTAIKKRIQELKAEIRRLNAELKRLELKLRRLDPKSARSVKKATKTSKKSIRERLREILEKKRKARKSRSSN